MGLFGGGNSSSNTNTTNNTDNYTFNNVDNRIGDHGGLDGNTNFNLANSNITGGVKVEKTDLGAISKAFDFADNTLDFAKTASAPSANTINTIGKNATMLAAVVAVAVILKSRFKK